MITRKLVSQRSTFTRVYEVEGIEPVAMSGNVATLYSPTKVSVTIQDGAEYATVYGARVLKSGKTSAVQTVIRSLTYCGPKLRPSWLVDLISETMRASA